MDHPIPVVQVTIQEALVNNLMGGVRLVSGGQSTWALSQTDRAQFSTALLNFFDELEPLIQSGFGEAVAGSRAARLTAGNFQSQSQGPHPGRSALETVLFATLAGLDHSRLMARALLREDAAFSIATLTRGAIEAYARAWWMIEPQDDEETVVRWLSALASELKMFAHVKPDAVLNEMRGRSSDAKTELRKVLDDIELITGSRTPRKVNYTELAASLADQWKAEGRAVYSDLSGVAHAESLGIHSFVEVDDHTGAYRVELSGRWGLMSANWVLAATTLASRAVLQLLGTEMPPTHACAKAHYAAEAVLASANARLLTQTKNASAT